MRHVGEQRAERDRTLDTELLREAEHEAGKRLPAKVWLGAEQDDRVTLRAGNRGVVERVLGPLELPRHPVLE
jgi:hypothetical protein